MLAKKYYSWGGQLVSTYKNGGRIKGEGETPKTSKNTSQRRKTQGPVTYYYLILPYSNHAARATLGMYLEKKCPQQVCTLGTCTWV